MPTNVTTLLTITGASEALDAFRERHMVPTFSFDTIVPMPSSVKATSDDSGNLYVHLYTRALITESRKHARIPVTGPLMVLGGQAKMIDDRAWVPLDVHTWQDVLDWLDRTEPSTKAAAVRRLLCAAETGYPGWYEWSCVNWGTKWDAYDVEMIFRRVMNRDAFLIWFRTATHAPEPIFRRLAQLWPGLTFSVEAVHENGPEFVGLYHGDAQTFGPVEIDPERTRRVLGASA